MKRTVILVMILLTGSGIVWAQDPDENKLKISGELISDERFLFRNGNDWAWNENRLTLRFDKKIAGNSKFFGEVWSRNIGLPDITSTAGLYNKGIVDPLNIEIREANIELYGFLLKNLDLKIGRQIIAWGKADKINPTSNLNPLDMEDILDFGRRRGSDAINANYYISSDFSVQGIYMPFFRPANLPVGIFANALNPIMRLPAGMTLKGVSDTLLMPEYNLKESSVAGFRFQGYAGGVDFSLSYVWGYDGLPVATRNTFIPVDLLGGVNISSQLSFMRTHIAGADFAADIAGIGLWGEAALFIPDEEIIMTTDLSALYPMSPVPVTVDSVLIDKSYIKFIFGGDYNFGDGSYFNLQYLHGFFHEKGSGELNDYIFARYEKGFFNNRLKISPLSGALIISDWKSIGDAYTIAYLPQILFAATADVEITLSAALFTGKGESLFASMKDYDMFMFRMKYNF